MNRSLSVRSRTNTGGAEKSSGKHRFTMASLRGIKQPELSKKLYVLIKTENNAISAYENAGKQQAAIASQLSDWGEETGDEAISDVADKLGVLLAEIAEQEEGFANGLEDSRAVLKQIRNTEASVQPSRDQKNKIQDEIQKLKYKEPSSTKLVTLEQELVRAEAQSLVAEAQLTNITRQKFKEAYDLHTAAIIERAEKQILLAKNARKILNLIDDTPIVPGDAHPAFDQVEAGREILNMAENDLRSWTPNLSPIHSNAHGLGSNAMPTSRMASDVTTSAQADIPTATAAPTYTEGPTVAAAPKYTGAHLVDSVEEEGEHVDNYRAQEQYVDNHRAQEAVPHTHTHTHSQASNYGPTPIDVPYSAEQERYV